MSKIQLMDTKKENILRPQDNKNTATLSILVIARNDLNDSLSKALREVNQKQGKRKLHIIKCENIDEILHFVSTIHVDFIVFVIDTEFNTCVRNVEINMQKIDISFLCGQMVLVDGNPNIPRADMNATVNSLCALSRKYKIPLLNGEIKNTEKCQHLAQRLLILANAFLGLNHTLPFAPWLANAHD